MHTYLHQLRSCTPGLDIPSLGSTAFFLIEKDLISGGPDFNEIPTCFMDMNLIQLDREQSSLDLPVFNYKPSLEFDASYELSQEIRPGLN